MKIIEIKNNVSSKGINKLKISFNNLHVMNIIDNF